MIEVEKRTSLGKRIAIWVIAGLMTASVVVVFANIILSGQNAETERQGVAEAEAEMERLLEERDELVAAQAQELSEKYARDFYGFKQYVGEFGPVEELRREDLRHGDGEIIADGVRFSAYYIGFLSDGTVFDSSFVDFDAGLDEEDLAGVLTLPLSGTLGSGGFIEGFLGGIEGMRVGGVRKISIPSELGYGGEALNMIPADSDLTFIVMMVPRIDAIPFDDRLVDLCIVAYSVYAEQYGEEYIEMVCIQEFGNLF